MNYIKHLNAIFLEFSEDIRLNATHISMYMALFHTWNINRFSDEFFIDRQETMQLSKIGSKTTYHRCLNDLNDWNYIQYLPSHNPFKGSRIRMAKFGTSYNQVSDEKKTSSEPSYGQELVSNTNNFKLGKTNDKLSVESKPKNDLIVIDFFKERSYPEIEAQKFFNHYQGVGWKIGGKVPIQDWKATADNWMLRANEISRKTDQSHGKETIDYLKTKKEKNYSEPL